ncbi:DUF397 domain-containing protein [Streptomyces sp. Tu 2975]|uniref:DUF397 domain-containing protein n=1 Tax=Streptomyces sp. Tu 2975 TaxID=2676871 RepID=UPI001FC95D4E|nr:DUF397 domain-containing protein [Streptomyces sp. Tu 2975]
MHDRPARTAHRPSVPAGFAAHSNHSGSTGGDCVEVADGCPTAAVPVRGSKNPDGPVVVVGAGAWRAFVDGLR